MSLGSCCWASGGTGGCWAAGKSPGKSRCAACGARSVPGCGTEPGGCAGGCTRCALEPALEEELEREKERKATVGVKAELETQF